jgi:phosphate-selective porin OprO/OprP
MLFLAGPTATRARADDPPPAPAPTPPAPSPSPPPPGDPSTRELLDRLKAMEEKLDRVTQEKDELSRQVQELSNRVDPPAADALGRTPWESTGVPTPAASRPSGLTGPADNSAPVSGGSGFTRGGQTGATNASVGGGASRKANAQDIGNRRLGKIPIKTRYDYERFGLLFSTEDDELTMKINLMSQVDAKIYSPAGGDPTQSGWYVPRSRIYFTGRLTKPVAYHLSFQDSNGGGLQVLNAYLDFARDERFQIRVGRFKTPYTYEFYKIPVYELLAPERSIYNVNFQGNRQIGAMAWGEVLDGRLEYAVGPFDGPRNSYQDFNSTPDIFAFVNITPFLKSETKWLQNFNIGGSLDWGVQNNPVSPTSLRTNQQTATDVPTSTSAASSSTVPFLGFNSNVRERGVRELWELHAAYFNKGLSMLAAWDAGFDSYATTGNRPISVPVGGFSIQAAYLLTGETVNDNALIDPLHPFDVRPGRFGLGAIQPTARYSTIYLGRQVFTGGFADPNQWTDHVQMTDVGFNWYLNKWTKVYFDWEHAMFASPIVLSPGKSQLTSDLFWFRFQFYY